MELNLFGIGGTTALIAVAVWHFGSELVRPVHKIPIATAEARLTHMTFEEGMLTRLPFTMSAAGGPGARTLRWEIGELRAGARPASCTVELKAKAPERTTADLECAVNSRNPDPDIAEASSKLLKLVMSEHVKAALAAQPFDHDSMGRKLIAFSGTHRAVFARETARDFRQAEAPAAK